jgi:hypothetical protein
MTRIRLMVVVLFSAALFCGAITGLSQTATTNPAAPVAQSAVQPAPHPQFFAGTVVELDASHIKITRTLVGRPTESRSFAINPLTKMNKAAIKLHNRVTVRYKHLNDGDIALEIQPRPVITRTPKS